ncbi:tetratricopeptide repeat-containing protein [Methylicorpusculum sp.]|uniref:tetratricopeptide repeat-containing protein n=1 Tax=Methylicorpusculum sp. TaxID=2713644 RepID=UPI00273162AF|nr:tetratricopeptide repeat-containing protein [Methylicorpusculum sp.]MDP2179416.1 patatin-like phospholipase family protein [Methylicorpusculum sp.]MDP3529624.1 patatin-like phospholipase family protein [Methylicorpusculum sp.]MDZ4152432.1 tetratricopeptide repeat-containing protein [Methylicorpusculum sp.]
MANSNEISGQTGSDREKLPDLQELKTRVRDYKSKQNFGDARDLLEKARREYPDEVWVTQQLALCTYKDEELYPKTRLKTALELLETVGLRNADTKNSETLAMGGAIYKRMWEFDGQLDHLYESLAFYRAAFERNPEQDMGYGGINAAYLLDLLAARAEGLEARSGLKSKEAPKFRKEAKDLRNKVREHLLASQQKNPELADQYWFLATVGEACFGMGLYAEAAQWLDKTQSVSVDEWELQTTFRQWVGIARQQHIYAPDETQEPEDWHEAWQTLQHLLGDETAEALVCHRGKVGLALSGGGFRASFFHLGVMARLAEADALRGVDVLSTVSGGSILGMQYYLEVQKLFEESAKKLSQNDYLDIVEKLQNDFLKGVETNIRMRAFGDFAANVRMLFSKSYSRSHKLGELYETNLYSKVADGKNDQPRTMPDLLVKPAQGRFQGDSFKPNAHNWRRRAKVPVLLLNTTSLNSGHNWFFTAAWMGEPPGLIDVDSNERFRRLYYYQAPEHLKKFRVGYAAAASSCVPGLFEPLVLDKLYQDRTVKLVDGGVYDNQGVQGLLAEGCTLILCSDASGQMPDSYDPAEDPGGVLLRTVSVLQDRVRESQYQDLQGRLDSRALHGVFFIHTQKELDPKPLDWIGCQDPKPDIPASKVTSYGIAKDLQKKIAGLRTDLDSFTEVEAYALMASGYLMADKQLKDLDQQHKKEGKPGTWGDFNIYAEQQRDWEFLKLKEVLAEEAGEQASAKRKDLELQLNVGSELFFKAWQLIPWLKIVSGVAAVLILWLSIKLVVSQWDNTLFSISVGKAMIALLGFVAALLFPALKWLNPKEEARSWVIKFAIAITGYCMAKLHLAIFDPLFLARGRLARLLDLDKK